MNFPVCENRLDFMMNGDIYLIFRDITVGTVKKYKWMWGHNCISPEGHYACEAKVRMANAWRRASSLSLGYCCSSC